MLRFDVLIKESNEYLEDKLTGVCATFTDDCVRIGYNNDDANKLALSLAEDAGYEFFVYEVFTYEINDDYNSVKKLIDYNYGIFQQIDNYSEMACLAQ